MSDTMRWRYGDTNPVVLPVQSAMTIEIGDLLLWDTDHVVAANCLADTGTEAGNQAAFHTAFAGVAMQRSRVGDTAPIRVATTGVFEFEQASGTAEVGDLIGAAANAGQLVNQKVAVVGDIASAIGRCAKRVSPASTRILVDIVSTLAHGGPQAAAA